MSNNNNYDPIISPSTKTKQDQANRQALDFRFISQLATAPAARVKSQPQKKFKHNGSRFLPPMSDKFAAITRTFRVPGSETNRLLGWRLTA